MYYIAATLWTLQDIKNYKFSYGCKLYNLVLFNRAVMRNNLVNSMQQSFRHPYSEV